MDLYKVFTIIPKRRRKQLPLVCSAMALGAALEVLGIGLIIPLMDIISGSNNQATILMKSYFAIDNDQYIAVYSIALFALIYLLKGIYLSALAWITAHFSFGVKADVCNILFEKYLMAPYGFHLQKNSAQLIRNLTSEASQLGGNVLNPLVTIASESFVIVAIGIFLLVIEPLGTIIVMTLLIILSYAFHRFLVGYTRGLGQKRQHAEGMIIQKSQESLGGIKDVKVLGKEMQFKKQFRKHNLMSSDALAKQQTLAQVPRMYLETVAVIAFSILIFLMLIKGGDFSQIIPVLGVFALAAFRLLPSTNRILAAINALRFADSVVTCFYTEMTTLTSKDLQDGNSNVGITYPSFQSNIEIKDICYQYPNSKEFALSGINLTISKGESIGIVGKSGSGKSTLSDLILGLLSPTAGAISIDGVSIERNIKEWQRLIGYVQQDIFLIDDNIKRNIAFGEIDSEIDHNKIASAINEAQLSDFINSLPKGINTRLGERGVRLSGGQKQRIGIARALYRNAPILIFDEATSALDNQTESEIVAAIKRLKGKRTMIVIAHRLSTIEHCDRVVEMKKGHIYKINKTIS